MKTSMTITAPSFFSMAMFFLPCRFPLSWYFANDFIFIKSFVFQRVTINLDLNVRGYDFIIFKLMPSCVSAMLQ